MQISGMWVALMLLWTGAGTQTINCGSWLQFLVLPTVMETREEAERKIKAGIYGINEELLTNLFVSNIFKMLNGRLK